MARTYLTQAEAAYCACLRPDAYVALKRMDAKKHSKYDTHCA
jgi:hypothetical protein